MSGPRSEFAPDALRLDSIENGIWMCESHGSLIDKNGGRDYSPRLLLKWRAQAEERAAVAQGSSSKLTPSIDAIRIDKNLSRGQLFEFEAIRVELFDFTVLYAKHDRALSMVCRSLAKAPEYPAEALSYLESNDLTISVDYSPGFRPPTRISFDSGNVRYWDGHATATSIEGFYEAVLVDRDSLVHGIPSAVRGGFYAHNISTNGGRERLVAKDPMLTEKLAARIKDEDNVMVEDIRIRGGHWDVRCRGHEPNEYFRLQSLSSSEQMSVHIDLTLALLRTSAGRNPRSPFLLIVDNVLWCYDNQNLKKFVSVCSRLPANVQVIVTDATGRVADTLKQYRQDLEVSRRQDPPGYIVSQSPELIA